MAIGALGASGQLAPSLAVADFKLDRGPATIPVRPMGGKRVRALLRIQFGVTRSLAILPVTKHSVKSINHLALSDIIILY